MRIQRRWVGGTALVAALGLCTALWAGCETSCACAWEGGQGFSLTEARLDGEILYLSMQVTGAPCCDSTWREDVVYRVDLTGYPAEGGDLNATLAQSASGTTLTQGEDLDVDLPGLGLTLQRNPDLIMISVVADTTPLLEISDTTDGTVLGLITVDCGPAVH